MYSKTPLLGPPDLVWGKMVFILGWWYYYWATIKQKSMK